jgi:cell division septation protein DedD
VEVKKFRTFQQAKKFLTQLRKQGHQAYIAKQPQAKSPFGVWLGPFQNRQQAQAAAQAVRKKYRVSPQVRTQPALPPK